MPKVSQLVFRSGRFDDDDDDVRITVTRHDGEGRTIQNGEGHTIQTLRAHGREHGHGCGARSGGYTAADDRPPTHFRSCRLSLSVSVKNYVGGLR